jgi:hypothetical protein
LQPGQQGRDQIAFLRFHEYLPVAKGPPAPAAPR